MPDQEGCSQSLKAGNEEEGQCSFAGSSTTDPGDQCNVKDIRGISCEKCRICTVYDLLFLFVFNVRTYTGNGKTDSQHVCQMGSQSHTDQCFFYLYLYLPWKHRLTSSKSLWVCTLKPATPADRFQVFKNCLRPRFPPSPWQTGLKQRASIESDPVLFFAFLGYGYGHHYDLKLVKIPLDFIKATGFEQRALIENGPEKNTSMIVLIINSQSFKLIEDS